MINSSEQAVDFLGHRINCIQDADGSPYVPLKWLCEILGIDHNRQRREVKDDGAFAWKILSVKGADGRHRQTFCVTLKQMYLWLYTVGANTVRPEIKKKLLQFKEESATPFRHARQYGLAFSPRMPAEEIESRVRESGYRYLQEQFPGGGYSVQDRVALLMAELEVFRQFDNEPAPYRDKARECIGVAVDRFFEWKIRHRHDPYHSTIHKRKTS